MTSSRQRPVHLWDGYTGKVRASYTVPRGLEGYADVLSLSFSADGRALICGSHNSLSVFDTARPGAGPLVSAGTLPGYIGAVAAPPSGNSLFAAGTYDGKVALLTTSDILLIDTLPQNCHPGGVTQLRFSRDGTLLFTGGRRDSSIYVCLCLPPLFFLFSFIYCTSPPSSPRSVGTFATLAPRCMHSRETPGRRRGSSLTSEQTRTRQSPSS